MAPPSNRRPGFSRRAQYSTFAAYLAAAAGVALGAFLLITSGRSDKAASGIRGLAADLASPPANAAASAVVASKGWLDTLSGYLVSGSETARLRKEVEIARVRKIEADALAAENRQLKALLGLVETTGRPVAVARLIGSSHASTRRLAMLNAGSAAGVKPGMPVRSDQGLVGRVMETGRLTSRVLLVTDAESIVPVKRAADGVAAFATGRGDGLLQIRLVNLGVNPLKPGDTFVTSGSGGLYRPGVAIAIVTKVTADGGIARALGNPAVAELVIVEPEWIGASTPGPELGPGNANADTP